jgi:hypothetical protein
VGVSLANIVWVIAVVALPKLLASQLPPWPDAAPLLKAFAALILVFIATRAAVSAVVIGIEAHILKTWSTAASADLGSLSSGVGRGFMVHLFNPLTFTYYLGAYSGTLATDPSLAFLFALVAVVVDFLVYAAVASVPVGRLLAGSPMTFVFQRVFVLIAAFAMLFLVAHVFAMDRGDHAARELHGLRNFLMLLGFLAGVIYEAEKFAVRYGGTKNKLLWRGVLVWQSAFGTFTIVGAFLSVLVRIDPDSIGIGKSLISEIAICSLVAAVATVALSYARARGEMLDEAANADGGGLATNLVRTQAFNSPKFVFPALFAGLILLIIFFAVSGFSN